MESEKNKAVHYGVAIVVFLLFLSAFSLRKPLKTDSIQVNIAKQYEQELVTEHDVSRLVDSLIEGSKNELSNLHRFEKSLTEMPFIQQANFYLNNQGVLKIDIEQEKPLARVVGAQTKGYLNENGKVFATSPFRTSRNIVITGVGTENFVVTEKNPEWRSKFLEMLRYLRKNEFFEYQIAQIEVFDDGELTLYPQVGDQIIRFGKPENFEHKFKRLLAFYKQVIPKAGWAKYNEITLKYDEQIICK
jgi:cell division protein FtsQ